MSSMLETRAIRIHKPGQNCSRRSRSRVQNSPSPTDGPADACREACKNLSFGPESRCARGQNCSRSLCNNRLDTGLRSRSTGCSPVSVGALAGAPIGDVLTRAICLARRTGCKHHRIYHAEGTFAQVSRHCGVLKRAWFEAASTELYSPERVAPYAAQKGKWLQAIVKDRPMYIGGGLVGVVVIVLLVLLVLGRI